MEISFCSHPSTNKVIATKFGTWHDSWAFVACAKFCCDMINCNWIRTAWIFDRIWIVMEKSLVKWVPGSESEAGPEFWEHIAPKNGIARWWQLNWEIYSQNGNLGIVCYQVEAQLDYGPGSEIGAGWKIGVTLSQKRSFKMAATELGYLLTKSPFWLSLWHDISISWHGGKEL